MDEDFRHPERICHHAGVLATRPAKRVQGIGADIVSPCDRDLLHGFRHIGDGDLEKAVGHLFTAPPVTNLLGERVEGGLDREIVERLVLAFAEDRWEHVGYQLADHDIGIGNGEWPIPAITLGTGIGTGGFRADAETRAVIAQERSTAGRDRMDLHHRRAHADAGDLGFECPLIFSVEMCNIRRGAAHVEADHFCKTGFCAGLRKSDHTARGPRQNGILSLEQAGGSQSAR